MQFALCMLERERHQLMADLTLERDAAVQGRVFI